MGSAFERYSGFAPVFDENSRVLVLGSFPSVKSRQDGFYYGNPQNRFWRMLCGFFQEEIPATVAGKIEFLLRNKVALWDMVASCEIVGSADASIKREEVVDVHTILEHAPIECVLCNGTKSYELLVKQFPQFLSITKKMPSTSPANPRYKEAEWHTALYEIFFGRYE
ncbi:MAG: DNA-deoxyinosine glycosylase [Clostridia bacterium]|nr:DNA-deoxyinosine glycosylase [Clostridia bacterium]